MTYWFISDTHFGHANIIRYCNRPFLKEGDLTSKGFWTSEQISLERCKWMDEIIIKNWNERVKKGDVVFFLGDFCFRKSAEAPEGNVFEYYRNQLNGDIIFIKGNHEKSNKVKTIIEHIKIKHGGKAIFLTHNPQFANLNYSLNFCGHVHDKWKIKKIKRTIIVNLSVENWDYYPRNINEIFSEIEKWKKRKK